NKSSSLKSLVLNYPQQQFIDNAEVRPTMRITRLFLCSSIFFFAATATFSQTAPPAAKPKSTAASASPYDRTLLKPALLKDTAPATFQVKFSTTRGDFTVTVTRAWAPNGVDRFYNLVKHHYYDGARVYRVVPGF